MIIDPSLRRAQAKGYVDAHGRPYLYATPCFDARNAYKESHAAIAAWDAANAESLHADGSYRRMPL